jgi:hypothetical protein
MQELNTAARGKVSALSAHTGWARSDPKETQAPRRSSDALPPQMSALGFLLSSVSLAHSQLILSLKPVAQCVGPDLCFAPNKSGRPFGESHHQSALQQLVVAEERLRVSRRCTKASCSKCSFAFLPSRNARPASNTRTSVLCKELAHFGRLFSAS